MLGLGMQELLMILVIVLLFFGGKKLPEIASGMGKAVHEFKRATTESEPPGGPGHSLPQPSATNETTDHAVHTRG